MKVLASVAQGGFDPGDVSPGLLGFLATFALVVVSILLFVNMSRRLRRMQYREEQEAARRERETREREARDGRHQQDGTS